MQITNRIFQVGVENPTLRIFDIIMQTKYGTTYNSYVVKGDNKVAVVDGAHNGYEHIWLDNIRELVRPEDIDYLIINHTEPDHAGGVKALLELNPNVKVFGTGAAMKNLQAITAMDFDDNKIEDKQTLDLGGLTLEFMVAPNIHWPDTMMTYVQEEKAVLSCDFLGAHFCEPTGFVDTTIKKDYYYDEFKVYYDAIMGPFAPFVQKALARINEKDVQVVCPSHGPVLRGDDIATAKKLYNEWSSPKQSDKKAVAIYYVSAYGYTRRMSQYLAGKLQDKGLDVYIADVIKTDPAEIAAHLGADCLVFGSPTINRAALKPIWDTISCIDAINTRGRYYATLGCYGWSGEAVAQLNARLEGLNLKPAAESVRSRFTPTDEIWTALDQMAEDIAAKLS